MKFQKVRKAVKTTCNINNAFGSGTANEWTVQWWFKKFCKGDENFEDEERSGRPSEVDNYQLRAIIEADSTRKVAKELNGYRSIVIQHLKQTGKVKKLDKVVPHDLTANQKNHCFEVSSSLILHNNNGKVKKLNKVMPHDLTTNQKNHCFEVSSSLILHNNNEPCLSRIASYVEKWILYDSW